MKIKISVAENFSKKWLTNLNYSEEKADLTVKNIIEAEISGKISHGLSKLLAIKSVIDKKMPLDSDYLDYVSPQTDYNIVSEGSTHLHIDAQYSPGAYVIYKSLDFALEKVRDAKICVVGIKDLGFTSGYIGAYARDVASKSLIYLGFHNSSGGLVPYGARRDPWGTNPITCGIPSNGYPVIIDSAMSKITWSAIVDAKRDGIRLPKNVAIDNDGNYITDPTGMVRGIGGILPIGGRKGSSLAFMVELLAGALTDSRCGCNVKGGWGAFYILIDPTLLRPLEEFKKDVDIAIKELKGLPRAKGVKEIFYPGERSGKQRAKQLKQGWVDVDEKLWEEIEKLVG
jgi:L-2-hydroxycarboxylate dehydrogenase (NAD+)